MGAGAPRAVSRRREPRPARSAASRSRLWREIRRPDAGVPPPPHPAIRRPDETRLRPAPRASLHPAARLDPAPAGRRQPPRPFRATGRTAVALLMHAVILPRIGTVAAWRDHARSLAQQGVP